MDSDMKRSRTPVGLGGCVLGIACVQLRSNDRDHARSFSSALFMGCPVVSGSCCRYVRAARKVFNVAAGSIVMVYTGRGSETPQRIA